MSTTPAPDSPHRPTRVVDGGMETDLIFHHGIDLPDFAAFPLVLDEAGRALLTDYFDGFARVAEAAGANLDLDSPTWRANSDWGDRLGHTVETLARANRAAVDLLRGLAARYSDRVATVRVNGMLGPRADAYSPAMVMSADEAAVYHRPQIAALVDAGAEGIVAYTLGYAAEAVGIVEAARDVGASVDLSFTVETDGTLPDGTPLAAAISRVDSAAAPDAYRLNCAHPDHIANALTDSLLDRIIGVRYNASRRSHAELDNSPDLDEGDIVDLVHAHKRLAARLPALDVIGGCCGTDARHVAALWGVPAA